MESGRRRSQRDAKHEENAACTEDRVPTARMAKLPLRAKNDPLADDQ